jgi:glucosamine-phosphate N-acetyltransferase
MNIRDFSSFAKNELFGEKLHIRRLEEGDYHLGFLSVLSILTTVGTVTEEKWLEQYRDISSNPCIEIWVIHDTGINEIVGTATLLIEPKFIHECGRVGHIEDLVLSKRTHGTGLGKKIVTFLAEQAKLRGCYKVILDCTKETIGFYEKCGFTVKNTQMGLYF